MGLGRVGVKSALQRRGAGRALIEAGLGARCAAPEPVEFVLGHASYYPRFDFRPAWDAGCYYGRPGPNPSFMVTELESGALSGRAGQVRYHDAFDFV